MRFYSNKGTSHKLLNLHKFLINFPFFKHCDLSHILKAWYTCKSCALQLDYSSAELDFRLQKKNQSDVIMLFARCQTVFWQPLVSLK